MHEHFTIHEIEPSAHISTLQAASLTVMRLWFHVASLWSFWFSTVKGLQRGSADMIGFCWFWFRCWWGLQVVFVYMISKLALPRSASVHQYFQVACSPYTLQNTRSLVLYGTWDSAMNTHQLLFFANSISHCNVGFILHSCNCDVMFHRIAGIGCLHAIDVWFVFV